MKLCVPLFGSPPNPWTKQTETVPVLDWAISVFDAVNQNLEKLDYQFNYREGQPPVDPTFCQPSLQGEAIPEGELIETIKVDPPLGPETDAFFAEVQEQLNNPPLPNGPMLADPVALCDFNRDGLCDAVDFALLQLASGKCRGEAGYHPSADPDQDGCVTPADQEILFPEGVLISLSPAKVWVGLKNSDAVGLRLDLRTEVLLNGTKIAQGELNGHRECLARREMPNGGGGHCDPDVRDRQQVGSIMSSRDDEAWRRLFVRGIAMRLRQLTVLVEDRDGGYVKVRPEGRLESLWVATWELECAK